MFTIDDVELLKAQLKKCYGCYVDLLVHSTKLSRTTVSKFLNHKPVKNTTQTLIYKTGCELITMKNFQDESMIRNLRKLAKQSANSNSQVQLDLNS